MEGLDSQQANDLLTAAGTGQAGITAEIVVTPRDDADTFFDSAPARAALAKVQSAQPRCLTCCRPAIRAVLWLPGPTRHGTAVSCRRTDAWHSCASSTRRWTR